MGVNWVGAAKAHRRQRGPQDGGAQRGLRWWRKPGCRKETGRGGRPGPEGPAGLGAASFLPSDDGYGKWTWCNLGVKSSLRSCGENGPQRPEGGRRGSSEEAKGVYIIMGPLEPPGKLGCYSW